MQKALSFIDANLQRGSLGLVLVGAVATTVLMLYALLDPGGFSGDLLFVLLGLALTWRHYSVWRRRRDQGGVELLGTERELRWMYPDAR